ncbi:hypothetical protein J4E91_004964 [Alternaria rosae]|nr:hypothetical protein J4E91_004964 [Alternaria rosae]
MNFVQPQQQYQHYPQQQFGNVLPDADRMNFPSDSSEGTWDQVASAAMGPQPSGNAFWERALGPEDFQRAGLNFEPVQNGVPNESGGEVQLPSDFLEFQDFSLDPFLNMAPLESSDGWYNLNQMASRPIFYQPPIPAPPPDPVPRYQPHDHYGVPNQLALTGPTFTSYNVAGAYLTPDATTIYATQQAHFQPTFQPGHNHILQDRSYTRPQPAVSSLQLPAYANGYPQQQPGPMYAPGYVNNFVVQQPQPTTCTQLCQRQPTAQSHANYPVADCNLPAAYAGPSSQQPGNYNNSTGQAQQQHAGSRRRRPRSSAT